MNNTKKDFIIKTFKLKIKNESYSWLNDAAIEVNQVWNYANEASLNAIKPIHGKPKWLSGFDLNNLTSGASKHFDKIGSETIQRVCQEYAQKRFQTKKRKLRWRCSFGPRRSLGWIPFKAASLKRKGKHLRFAGKTFRVFESHRLDNVKWKQGCFTQDAMGDWWLCLPVEVEITNNPAPNEKVGIDLGLKNTATTSDGETMQPGRYFRDTEHKIAEKQRRGHKKQAKRLHRKVKRQRADALHKFSRSVVDRYQKIVIGDVSSSKLAKTDMAKAIYDSGWYMLKTQLQYKGQQAGRSVKIVNEAYTTQACSDCGSLSGPQGRTGLVVRSWICGECGASHDRDTNAAKNILLRAEVPVSVCGNELPIKEVVI